MAGQNTFKILLLFAFLNGVTTLIFTNTYKKIHSNPFYLLTEFQISRILIRIVLDLLGISFHNMVVFGLGKDLF
jgi:hypothetical protein